MYAFFKNGEYLFLQQNSNDPEGVKVLENLKKGKIKKFSIKKTDKIKKYPVDREKIKDFDISLENGEIVYSKKEKSIKKENDKQRKAELFEKLKKKTATLKETQEYLTLIHG